MPSEKLETWFWLESDRLLHPVFREFYKEKRVIREERGLRIESTPTGSLDAETHQHRHQLAALGRFDTTEYQRARFAASSGTRILIQRAKSTSTIAVISAIE